MSGSWLSHDERSLVDTNDFDLGGVDSERTGKPINKFGGSSIVEELVHGPLHSNHGLNGVSLFDLEGAAGGDVELEDVLDTNVAVLATERESNWAILIKCLVPLVILDELTVNLNSTRLS